MRTVTHIYQPEFKISAVFSEEDGDVVVTFEDGSTLTSTETTLEKWINNGWEVVDAN